MKPIEEAISCQRSALSQTNFQKKKPRGVFALVQREALKAKSQREGIWLDH
jgi:hypothetical protein